VRAGLTQEELAERAGLTPPAISALERGARTRPYRPTVPLPDTAVRRISTAGDRSRRSPGRDDPGNRA
jgi:transcriptional regulator